MMAKVRRRSISPASGERLWLILLFAPGARIGAFMGAYLQSQGLNSRLVPHVCPGRGAAWSHKRVLDALWRSGAPLIRGPRFLSLRGLQPGSPDLRRITSCCAAPG